MNNPDSKVWYRIDYDGMPSFTLPEDEQQTLLEKIRAAGRNGEHQFVVPLQGDEVKIMDAALRTRNLWRLRKITKVAFGDSWRRHWINRVTGSEHEFAVKVFSFEKDWQQETYTYHDP